MIPFYRLENCPRERQSVQTLAITLQSQYFQLLQHRGQAHGLEQPEFPDFGWKSRPHAAFQRQRGVRSHTGFGERQTYFGIICLVTLVKLLYLTSGYLSTKWAE